jgi:hypothetical protein
LGSDECGVTFEKNRGSVVLSRKREGVVCQYQCQCSESLAGAGKAIKWHEIGKCSKSGEGCFVKYGSAREKEKGNNWRGRNTGKQ